MQTRRNATDLDAFTKAFDGRLMALNRAHELLTREIGTGVLVGDLIRETVAPYENRPGEKVVASGPDIRIGSEVAVTLAMALHELTTNAAKHGALSATNGRIQVEWRRVAGRGPGEPEEMRLTWSEHGGPKVAVPSRRGFGSDLIERGLARQLGGTASLTFREDGLICTISAPLPRSERPAA
jgi:two-component sensor histidine kinase